MMVTIFAPDPNIPATMTSARRTIDTCQYVASLIRPGKVLRLVRTSLELVSSPSSIAAGDGATAVNRVVKFAADFAAGYFTMYCFSN